MALNGDAFLRSLKVLELHVDATLDDIKKAYRRLALKYHPDKNQEVPDATTKFQELSEAYLLLKKTKERASRPRGYCPEHGSLSGDSDSDSDDFDDDYFYDDDDDDDADDDSFMLSFFRRLFMDVFSEFIFRRRFMSGKKQKKFTQEEEDEDKFFDFIYKKFRESTRRRTDEYELTEEDLKKFHSYDEWHTARDPRKRHNNSTRIKKSLISESTYGTPVATPSVSETFYSDGPFVAIPLRPDTEPSCMSPESTFPSPEASDRVHGHPTGDTIDKPNMLELLASVTSLELFACVTADQPRLACGTSTMSTKPTTPDRPEMYSIQCQTPYNLTRRRTVQSQIQPETRDFATQTDTHDTCVKTTKLILPPVSKPDVSFNDSFVSEMSEPDERLDPDWCPDDSRDISSDSDHDMSCSDTTSHSEEENKFIVYESRLDLLLSSKCTDCGQKTTKVKTTMGTFVKYKLTCSVCKFTREWGSQPLSGTMPYGNLSVAAAIMFSGASPMKVINAMKFSHIQFFSRKTYFAIQSAYLVPAIETVWKSSRMELLQQIIISDSELHVGGDARCCSPGHTAKYSSYSLMDLRRNKIIDMQLVQSNEVKNSYAMELEGLKRCFEFLEGNQVTVSDLVTDRHSQVKKYMREERPDIRHWFDVWHVAKGIYKKLEAVGKRKHCDVVGNWARSISNHLYWCAASSDGDGDLVQEKWFSILNHVTNIHEGHGEKFPRCAHGPLEDREWIKKGCTPYEAMEKVVKGRLLKTDIKKLSPAEQTSSLESYHHVVCYYAPKSVHFHYAQMQARLYLAALHFNENSSRAQAVTRDGEKQFRVSYPKSRRGAGVAAERAKKRNNERLPRDDGKPIRKKLLLSRQYSREQESKKIGEEMARSMKQKMSSTSRRTDQTARPMFHDEAIIQELQAQEEARRAEERQMETKMREMDGAEKRREKLKQRKEKKGMKRQVKLETAQPMEANNDAVAQNPFLTRMREFREQSENKENMEKAAKQQRLVDNPMQERKVKSSLLAHHFGAGDKPTISSNKPLTTPGSQSDPVSRRYPAPAPGAPQQSDPALLERHLQQYESLMKVQPQRHTEQQLRAERIHQHSEMLHRQHAELERLRHEQHDVQDTSNKSKPDSTAREFDTANFEKLRLQHLQKQRDLERKRNDEESRGIQGDRMYELKRKKPEPKWYESEKPARKPTPRSPQPTIWVPTPSPVKPPEETVWSRRQEVTDLRQEAISELLPKSAEDEEEMLRRALQLSQQTAQEDANRHRYLQEMASGPTNPQPQAYQAPVSQPQAYRAPVSQPQAYQAPVSQPQAYRRPDTQPQPYRPTGCKTQTSVGSTGDSIWYMEPTRAPLTNPRGAPTPQEQSYSTVARSQVPTRSGTQRDTQMHLEYADDQEQYSLEKGQGRLISQSQGRSEGHYNVGSNRALCEFNDYKANTREYKCDKRTPYEETAFSVSGDSGNSETWDDEVAEVTVRKTVGKEIGRDGQVCKVVKVETAVQQKPQPVTTPVIQVDPDACVKKHKAMNRTSPTAQTSPQGLRPGFDWKAGPTDLNSGHSQSHARSQSGTNQSQQSGQTRSQLGSTQSLPSRPNWSQQPDTTQSQYPAINQSQQAGATSHKTVFPSQGFNTDNEQRLPLPQRADARNKSIQQSRISDPAPLDINSNFNRVPTSHYDDVTSASQFPALTPHGAECSRDSDIPVKFNSTTGRGGFGVPPPQPERGERVIPDLTSKNDKLLEYSDKFKQTHKSSEVVSQTHQQHIHQTDHSLKAKLQPSQQYIPQVKEPHFASEPRASVSHPGKPQGLVESWDDDVTNTGTMETAVSTDNVQQPDSGRNGVREDRPHGYSASNHNRQMSRQRDPVTIPTFSDNLNCKPFNNAQLENKALTHEAPGNQPSSDHPGSHIAFPEDKADASRRLPVLKDLTNAQPQAPRLPKISMKTVASEPAETTASTDVSHVIHVKPGETKTQVSEATIPEDDTNPRASPVNDVATSGASSSNLPVGLPPHLVQAYLQYVAQTAAEKVNPGLAASNINPGLLGGSVPPFGIPNPFMAPFGAAPLCHPLMPFGMNPLMPMGNPLLALTLQQQMKQQMAAQQRFSTSESPPHVANSSPHPPGGNVNIAPQPDNRYTNNSPLPDSRNCDMPPRTDNNTAPPVASNTIPHPASSGSDPAPHLEHRPNQELHHTACVNNNAQSNTMNNLSNVEANASKFPEQADMYVPQPPITRNFSPPVTTATMTAGNNESLMDYTQMNASIADICHKVTNKQEPLNQTNMSTVNESLLDYSVMNASVADMMKKITLSNKTMGNESVADFSFMNKSQLNVPVKPSVPPGVPNDSLLDYTQMNTSVANVRHKFLPSGTVRINDSLNTSYMNASIKEPGQRVTHSSNLDEGATALRIPKQPAITSILPLKRSILADDPAVISADLPPGMATSSKSNVAQQPIHIMDPSVIKVSPKYETIAPAKEISKPNSDTRHTANQNAMPKCIGDYFPPDPSESDLDESQCEVPVRVASWLSRQPGISRVQTLPNTGSQPGISRAPTLPNTGSQPGISRAQTLPNTGSQPGISRAQTLPNTGSKGCPPEKQQTHMNQPFTNKAKQTVENEPRTTTTRPSYQGRGGFGNQSSGPKPKQLTASNETNRPTLGFSARTLHPRFSHGPQTYTGPNLPPRLQAKREQTQAVKEMIKNMRQQEVEQDSIPVDGEKSERNY